MSDFTFTDNIRKRKDEAAKAAQKEKLSAEEAKAPELEKRYHPWNRPQWVKKLGLDRLASKDGDTVELVLDLVPEPGCAINGVAFSPGVKALLPKELWEDIQRQCSWRKRQESHLFSTKKEQGTQIIGRYRG